MLEDVHQLVHPQRHWYIENLHRGSDVGKLLHGVPLDPFLRLDVNGRSGGDPAAGTSSTSKEKYSVPAVGEEDSPGSSHPPSPWGCMVC